MSDLGNEKIFAKNLKYYMEINNKTRYDVCKDLNLPYTTFAEWYNGKIYPRIDKIEMLANYFNIKKSDLIEEKTKTDILGNPVAYVPLLGVVKAGYNYLAQENWIGTVDVETSLVGDGKNYFALKVKGDSMAPVFMENDIVVIKKQNDCENNEYAVVIINGDEGTLKKIKKTDNGVILQPLNPAYRTCNVHKKGNGRNTYYNCRYSKTIKEGLLKWGFLQIFFQIIKWIFLIQERDLILTI